MPVPNPWLKKNPFMSMWLSGANAVAGSVRGQAGAQAKRQAATAVSTATQEMVKLWTSPLAMPAKPAPAARKTRKRR